MEKTTDRIPLPAEQCVMASIATLVVLSVFAPAFQQSAKDNFPWSSYPMFSFGRPDTHLTLSQALGVSAKGERFPLDNRLVGGSFEVLQTMMTIQRAIDGGPEFATALCNAILARIETREAEQVIAVELATSSFDTLDYFRNGHRPIERHVHTRCTKAQNR